MKVMRNIFIILSLCIFSCEKQTTDLKPDTDEIGTMAFQIDMSKAPAEVVKIIGTLSRNGYEDRIFRFNIEGETATASVEDLPAGVWRLKVDADNDSNVIIYTGSTEVYVVPGAVTPVSLHLNPATGSIYITVTWGDPDREWGETVNGIRISINLDDQELKPYDRAYSNILVENVFGDTVSFEAYVSFCLYDHSGVQRYQAFFSLSGGDSVDYFHPISLISFDEGNLINRTIEITGLPWVSTLSSKPPESDFYHLIQSGPYELQLQIEPIIPVLWIYPVQIITSNRIMVDVQSAESEKIIYYNSFENPSDTVGFSGYGFYDFNNEPSPNGGAYSLFVSGGCLWPHVMVEIPAQESDSYYRLEGWGRSLEGGGSVELHNNWPYRDESVYFSVSDSVWLYYTSDSILFCPAAKSMTLMMGAGGIIPGAMLVDQIKIIKTGF